MRAFFVPLLVAAAVNVANAQPKPGPPALMGATETHRFKAVTGFVDDVIASDDKRLAYVIADAASKAELHVVTLADGSERVVDIAPITLRPIAITLVGQRALVIGQAGDSQIGALVELTDTKDKKAAGTIVYKLGPATSLKVITRDGKPRVAVHRATVTKTGKRHDVEIVALETGKRLIAGRGLEVDATNANTKLEFRVNHFTDGMTRAVGIKSGTWDRKENERMPDVEVAYDVVAGKFIQTAKIVDLFEQRRRFQALAEAVDKVDFLRMAWDNSAVQVWHAGRFRTIELDQPLPSYDTKSLQGVVNADASAWVLLKVDPVNGEAVARKKADPEYLDIFKLGPGADTKATRRVRVLATGVRHRFGIVGDKLWLVERNTGFERGGKSLTIYQLP